MTPTPEPSFSSNHKSGISDHKNGITSFYQHLHSLTNYLIFHWLRLCEVHTVIVILQSKKGVKTCPFRSEYKWPRQSGAWSLPFLMSDGVDSG